MHEHVLDIVRRYVDDNIKRSGDGQVQVRCPFHKGGQERKPSFSVSTEKGLFHCFTCGASGTIPILLKMLGLPSDRIDAEIGPIKDRLKQNLEIAKHKRENQFVRNDPFRAHTVISESIIDGFDWCPTNLLNAGFSWQWLQYLQVGVDRTNQRVTYPIRDIYGNLAGFSGGATMAGQNPKYRVYQGRRRDSQGNVIPSDYGKWFDEEYPGYEFSNHDYLWNYDKVYPRLFFGKEKETLIIVEGFKAAIWLLQQGWKNTVALMGLSLSNLQKQLLLRVDARILLFLDNDLPGQDAVEKIGRNLLKATPAIWIAMYPPEIGEGSQPDDLDAYQIKQAIEGAIPFRSRSQERQQQW